MLFQQTVRRSLSSHFALGLALVLMMSACASQEETQETKIFDNEIVIDLNQLTYSIANEHDQFYSFIGVRALAMVHLALHDAFNAITPEFAPYTFEGGASMADPIAAAATATQLILEKAYPARKDTISMVCTKWLDQVEEGEAKAAGVQLGKSVATQLITLREGDGHEKQGDYTPMTKPGDYQYTPGFDYVWKPDFSYAKPFTLDSITQFRSPLPPSFESEIYLQSFEEVKTYGRKGSEERSVEQTHIGHWWAEFGEHSWNRIGRITAVERKLSLRETARLFALLNMNLYDLYLVSFDSKYNYDTWRPYTAIRAAERDNNPKTLADPQWEPEMVTPPWPEYPSAHAAVGAAGAEIVSEVYGTTNVSFTMTSVTAEPPGAERSYTNLDTVANHCAASRIWNGYHFRFATEEGKKQGRQLAQFVVSKFLVPLDQGEEEELSHN